MRLDIIDRQKGSNPGGVCYILDNRECFRAYFKFCYESKIHGISTFRAAHQPIYEAITFQLARQVGLATTDFYILLNENRNVSFHYWTDHQFKHDPNGRNFYFVSRWLPPEQDFVRNTVPPLLQHDLPYLASLQIGDIQRRQNYAWDIAEDGRERVIYIDLGRSFVLAADGELKLPHKATGYDRGLHKEAMRRLETKFLITRRQDLVNLAEMVDGISVMKLPTLNPRCSRTLSSLLNHAEIQEIQFYVAQGLYNQLPALQHSDLLMI